MTVHTPQLTQAATGKHAGVFRKLCIKLGFEFQTVSIIIGLQFRVSSSSSIAAQSYPVFVTARDRLLLLTAEKICWQMIYDAD